MKPMPIMPKLDSAACLVKFKRWGPVVFWMIVIFTASADSGSVAHSSQIIDPVCLWFWPNITASALENIHLVARKAAHMTEYALLALLLLRALSYDRGDARKWISSAWVLATAYAATDEFHQLFVDSRNGTVVDVLIDSAGAALGLAHGLLKVAFRLVKLGAQVRELLVVRLGVHKQQALRLLVLREQAPRLGRIGRQRLGVRRLALGELLLMRRDERLVR